MERSIDPMRKSETMALTENETPEAVIVSKVSVSSQKRNARKLERKPAIRYVIGRNSNAGRALVGRTSEIIFEKK